MQGLLDEVLYSATWDIKEAGSPLAGLDMENSIATYIHNILMRPDDDSEKEMMLEHLVASRMNINRLSSHYDEAGFLAEESNIDPGCS